MKIAITVPSVGESVTSAEISEWRKKTGDFVKKGEILLVLESDKASMDLPAKQDGILEIVKSSGEVLVEEKIGFITSADSPRGLSPATKETPAKSLSALSASKKAPSKKTDSVGPETPVPESLSKAFSPFDSQTGAFTNSLDSLSPAVRRLVESHKLDPLSIKGSGRAGRLTKGDVLKAIESGQALAGANRGTKPSPQAPSFQQENPPGGFKKSDSGEVQVLGPKTSPALETGLKPGQKKEKMSRLRRVIAERLVQSQQQTASLSTFNEVDLSRIIAIRKNYQKHFVQKYGFKLGFMSFFVRSVISALKAYPKLNAFVQGEHIIYNDFQHIGIAVGTDKGLVVPVLFNAESLSLAGIEQKILEYKQKALAQNLSPDDLLGGTFTISNGGVFGSLLSTPILNPPQSGILGMHKIQERPVVIDGDIQIRSMMYVTLSYDHRIVDGQESVGFLVKVKEGLEDPSRLLIDL